MRKEEEMENRTNYHSHCSFCDGHAPMEDFVRAAIRQQFSAYGFSSHAPLPYSTRWTMEKKDMPAYLAEFARLKAKYAGQIELYVGLEIDYLDETYNPSIPYFKELPLDYRIASLHILKDEAGTPVEIDCSKEDFRERVEAHFGGNLEQVARSYYAVQKRMLQLGGFDVLGHCDKLDSRAEYCRPGITGEAWYRAMQADFLDAVAESGIILEVNTKKFEEDGHFFPASSWFPELFRRKIPLVVNSDAHYPERINASRQEALKSLYAAGYRTVRELHGQQWESVPLRCG